MYAPLPSALLPVQVLFLSRSESSVRSDARLIRSLGVSGMTHLSKVEKAFAYLEAQLDSKKKEQAKKSKNKILPNAVDIVVLDEFLEDSTAYAFLSMMSRHELFRTQPCLAITGSPTSSKKLRGAGIYLLERPYTAHQMQRMIHKAMSPMRRILREGLFEDVQKKALPPQDKLKNKPAKPPPPLTTSDWMAKGQEYLKINKLPEAEEIFNRVIARQEDNIDACMGLAKIGYIMGDRQKMRRFLLRAAAASLRQDDKVRAAGISAMLPPQLRNNVFVHEAIVRLEEGEYRAAALGFLDAWKQAEQTPLHQLISRACLMTASPEDGMRKLCEAYEKMGHKAKANSLRQRLLTYNDYMSYNDSRSWLDNYPKLKEAVSVASFAAWAWKKA